MFDFELVHVPANHHKGPDALSRRPLAEGETVEEEDDSWLDNIALMSIVPSRTFPSFPKTNNLPDINIKDTTVQVFMSKISQEEQLENVYKFLETLKIPTFENIQLNVDLLLKQDIFL